MKEKKDGKWTEWDNSESYWKWGDDSFFDFLIDLPDIHFTGRYIKGKKEGEWEEFYKINTLISKGFYKNDMKEGIWHYNYKNGKLRSKGEYKNGLKDGQWISYDRSGYIQKEFFVNNNLIK